MRFVWSTALLLSALLIALGPLAGCAPVLDTTSLAPGATGTVAGRVSSSAISGELPTAAGRFRKEPARAEPWGSSVLSQRPGDPEGASRGSILVARGTSGEIQPGRPTQAMIAAELAEQFPGVPMKVVTDPLYNAYGPFGLAVGATQAGTACGYAWQWIQTQPRRPLGPGEAVSVRIQLCLGDRSPAALAGLVRQLALKTEGAPAAAARPATHASPLAAVRAIRSAPQAAPGPSQPGGRLYLAPLSGADGRTAAPAPADPIRPAGPIVPLPSAD